MSLAAFLAFHIEKKIYNNTEDTDDQIYTNKEWKDFQESYVDLFSHLDKKKTFSFCFPPCAELIEEYSPISGIR